MVCFAILNFTTTTQFANGLQKNAVAVVWIFFYLYFILRIIKYSQEKDFYYALLFLLLCVLTHFGSFTLLVFFSFLIGFFWLLYNEQIFQNINYKKIFIGVFVIFLFLSLIAFFDLPRLQRLMLIPLKVFEFPVYLLVSDGQNITNYISPIHLIIGTPLAILALILFIFNRKRMEKPEKIIGLALVFAAFFLSSPLLGLEWAQRLYNMSYIPIVIVYLIFFKTVQSKWVKAFPILIFIPFISLSVGVFRPHTDCITNKAYTEFKQIKSKIKFTENSVMVGGRQDLRLLGNWEFRTKSSADYLFTKEDFKKYDAVYVIRQINGSNFSTGRFRGDADIPANSTKIYEGNCFELYQLNNSDSLINGMGRPPRADGEIININRNKFVVKNKKTGRIKTVEFSKNTEFHFINQDNKMHTGMYVEIDGEWRPFSLTVDAETINEIKKPE